jgi:hypothetical protein
MITSFHKEFKVGAEAADALVVERARWERLKRRIRNLDERRPPSWISAAASAVFGIAASALITALAIPDGEGSGVDPIVKPLLFIGAAAGLVLTLAFVGFYRVERQALQSEGSDIVDEMETEEVAWVTDPAARGSGG